MSESFELRLLPCVRVGNGGLVDPLVGLARLRRFLPVVDENGTVTGQVVSVSEDSYQKAVSRLSVLSFGDFDRLRVLEDRVLYCGVDGGESTGEAIDKLEEAEKELGVFRDGAGGPRWRDYFEAVNRLCVE